MPQIFHKAVSFSFAVRASCYRRFMVTAILIRALVTVFRFVTERAILTSHMMESI